ncbi:helicase [Candidatus Poribacteria bacterium]|nr:helicase [Candidatus Poribacteria bacterium]
MHSVETTRYRALLAEYLRPQWRKVALLSALLLAGVGLNLLHPQIVRHFIDEARAGAAVRSLIMAGCVLLGAGVAGQIVQVMGSYVAENVGWIATNLLRADLALHCLRLDLRFHNDRTPGEMIERVDGDVTGLSNFLSQFILQIVGNALFLVGALVMIWIEGWTLGLTLSVFSGAAIAILIKLRHVAVPSFEAEREAFAAQFGVIEERLAGIEDIRTNGGDDYTMNRLYAVMGDAYAKVKRSAMLGHVVYGTADALFALSYLIVLGFGIVRYREGAFTIGSVYLVFHYTGMLQMPLQQLTRQLQDLQSATAGIVRIDELYKTKSALVERGTAQIPAGALSVEFDDVSFRYVEDEPVLQDVAFELAPGRTLGLLGRTGSGKTTITRLLFRLYDPDEGSVRLGGVDLRDAAVETVRQRVGMVTQDVQLFNASVRDNLTLFDFSVATARIEAVLSDLGMMEWANGLSDGLDTRLDATGAGLSAGQAQLLAFARVFVKDPGVVILDEPSSRLDPATERQLDHAVSRLLEGRTGIIIAHRLSTVRRVDNILILDSGRIAEQGERERLAADPDSRFAQLLRTGLEDELA